MANGEPFDADDEAHRQFRAKIEALVALELGTVDVRDSVDLTTESTEGARIAS